MREFSITIHFPSCKSKGILSEVFENAIKAEFGSDDYHFIFNSTGLPSDAYYDSGVSMFSVEKEGCNEYTLLNKRIKDVFNNLIDISSLPTSKN
jgi:hypothetical protein